MSDFTKDELIYLFEAVDSDIVCFNEPDIAYKVRDKLKSKINNYCDHDWDEYLCLERDVRECLKCGREENR